MFLIVRSLGGLLGLVNLACAILFLIQLGKAKGAVHVILGILSCCIYPLIWGWMNADQIDATTPPVAGLKYKQLVMIWTGVWATAIVLNVIASAMMRASM